MSVTVEQAAQRMGISVDEPSLPDLLTTADLMVGTELRASGERRIPTAVRDHAVLTLVRELWDRRNGSRSGIQWSPDGTSPLLPARDPMTPVAPILAPYKGRPAIG